MAPHEMDNKWVFRCALKTVNDSAVSRRLNGSSFHARGPAAAKDRSPNVLFVTLASSSTADSQWPIMWLQSAALVTIS